MYMILDEESEVSSADVIEQLDELTKDMDVSLIHIYGRAALAYYSITVMQQKKFLEQTILTKFRNMFQTGIPVSYTHLFLKTNSSIFYISIHFVGMQYDITLGNP